MKNLLSGIPRRERRALAILLALAVVGHLLRAVAAAPGVAPEAAQLFDPSSDGNPLDHRDSIRRQGRPLGEAERIDLDHASSDELARLPGIGPALAKRIVADRQSHGVFGSIQALGRVRGLGHAVLSRLAPHLSFGGVPAEAVVTSSPEGLDANRATVADLVTLPGIGPAKARAIVAFRDSVGPFRQLEDLRRVPGISGALLKRLAGRLVVP
ncbi:MAG: ComEA family DNA-binding protein [Gemmatimonadales bacterium]